MSPRFHEPNEAFENPTGALRAPYGRFKNPNGALSAPYIFGGARGLRTRVCQVFLRKLACTSLLVRTYLRELTYQAKRKPKGTPYEPSGNPYRWIWNINMIMNVNTNVNINMNLNLRKVCASISARCLREHLLARGLRVSPCVSFARGIACAHTHTRPHTRTHARAHARYNF